MGTDLKVDVYVRHSAGCRYDGDEKSQKCDCRKHLRWRQGGKQYRVKANTRSWKIADQFKRELEDQLNGRADTSKPVSEAKLLDEAVTDFLAMKAAEGITRGVQQKYVRLLASVEKFMNDRDVFTVQNINDQLVVKFVTDWPTQFPAHTTRLTRRESLNSFFRYCYEQEWMRKRLTVPMMKKPKAIDGDDDHIETQPLTAEEYKRLLDAVCISVGEGDPRGRKPGKEGRGRGQFSDTKHLQNAVTAFLQVMRWTGLAPIDVMTLKRRMVTFNKEKKIYHVTRKRNKTGVEVKVPFAKAVGDDLMNVERINDTYFFWSGKGLPQSAMSNWGQRCLAPVFRAAGIENPGNMLSYRLRDTFAVHLLEHGAEMAEVAKLLGNSLKVCEKHYAKWSKKRQDNVDALVARTFDPGH